MSFLKILKEWGGGGGGEGGRTIKIYDIMTFTKNSVKKAQFYLGDRSGQGSSNEPP